MILELIINKLPFTTNGKVNVLNWTLRTLIFPLSLTDEGILINWLFFKEKSLSIWVSSSKVILLQLSMNKLPATWRLAGNTMLLQLMIRKSLINKLSGNSIPSSFSIVTLPVPSCCFNSLS